MGEGKGGQGLGEDESFPLKETTTAMIVLFFSTRPCRSAVFPKAFYKP
jgi:hypothetical protein